MDALVELPGVGRKTANVVLGHALGVPGLPVDRHVLRVANRLGHRGRQTIPRSSRSSCATALPKERWTRVVGHADPARPPHLPSEADVRPLRRARSLPVLQDAWHVARPRPPKAGAAAKKRAAPSPRRRVK